MQLMMTICSVLWLRQSVLKLKKLTIIMLNYKKCSAACRRRKIYSLHVVVIVAAAFKTAFRLEGGRFMGT
jgi:hypothetical protein